MNWRNASALVILVAGTACHKNIRAVAPPSVSPPPVVAALPAELVEGDEAFSGGDYARAARAYDTYLQSSPQAGQMDYVLFRLGVSQSLSGMESASTGILNQLIREFPKSPYSPAARIIITLRADMVSLKDGQKAELKTRDDRIKQLNDDLENLKKIDLDRRRTQ